MGDHERHNQCLWCVSVTVSVVTLPVFTVGGVCVGVYDRERQSFSLYFLFCIIGLAQYQGESNIFEKN